MRLSIIAKLKAFIYLLKNIINKKFKYVFLRLIIIFNFINNINKYFKCFK